MTLLLIKIASVRTESTSYEGVCLANRFFLPNWPPKPTDEAWYLQVATDLEPWDTESPAFCSSQTREYTLSAEAISICVQLRYISLVICPWPVMCLRFGNISILNLPWVFSRCRSCRLPLFVTKSVVNNFERRPSSLSS